MCQEACIIQGPPKNIPGPLRPGLGVPPCDTNNAKSLNRLGALQKFRTEVQPPKIRGPRLSATQLGALVEACVLAEARFGLTTGRCSKK